MPAQATAPEAEAPKEPEAPKKGSPLKLRDLRRAGGSEVEHGLRDIKLLRPICHECAPEVEKAGHGWWDRCPHEPYESLRRLPETKTEYIDEIGDDGKPTGRRVVGETTTKNVVVPWPNFTGVAKGRRYNNNHGPEDKMLWYGFIPPEDLRSEAFPNGIAPCCEFRDCYWQDDLKVYANGTFCREIEAILVYENEVGTVPEVNNQDIRSDQYAVSRMKLLANRDA